MLPVSRVAPQMRSIVGQARQMSVVSGPPTVHISTAEKIVHGLLITTSIMAIPAWVLVNIKNYKARD